MADRATNVRDEIQEKYTEHISDNLNVSLEAAQKISEQLLEINDKIAESEEKAVSRAERYVKIKEKQVESEEELINLATKYKNDNVALSEVLEDQSEEYAEQINRMKFMLDVMAERMAADEAAGRLTEEQTKAYDEQAEKLAKQVEAKQKLLAATEEMQEATEAAMSKEDQYHKLRLKQEKDLQEAEENKQAKISKLKKAEAAAREIGDIRSANEFYWQRKDVEGANEPVSSSLKSLFGGKEDKDTENSTAAIFERTFGDGGPFENKLGKYMGPASTIAKGIDTVISVINSMRSVLNNYVNDATSFINSNKGTLNASLYGYQLAGNRYGNDYYRAFSETAESALATSGVLTQKEYLQQIRQLASQGIASGVETAALLSAVAEKTVPTFNATEGYIRRLVRLQEKNAAERFFGLESIIQGSLNAQFGESSYLNQLFDSVNDNLTDAITQLGDKLSGSYGFLNTTQTWLSYLYEQGIDPSTIQSLSQTINALGSGNVSGVSSNSGMQKLMLLSMDRANLDYATILQNGLDSATVNALFSSMADYLKNITTTTSSNNVLENAYANLFGLSMADMYAFGQLAQKPTQFYDVNNTTLENELTNRLNMVSENAYTNISEKIDNIISNLTFEFGNNIASSPAGYATWKIGNLAMDIGDQLKEDKGFHPIRNTIAKGIEAAGGVALMLDTVISGFDLMTDMYSSIKGAAGPNNNSLTNLYSKVSGHTIDITSTTNEFKALTSDTGPAAKTRTLSADAQNFKAEAETEAANASTETEDVKILKEFEKTLMKNKEGNLAVAVSLQAMSDEVLKSFASIFADEEAMTDVFKTKKSKNKLFDYGAEPTSASAQSQGAGRTITGSK